jgi:hypothetical protein
MAPTPDPAAQAMQRARRRRAKTTTQKPPATPPTADELSVDQVLAHLVEVVETLQPVQPGEPRRHDAIAGAAPGPPNRQQPSLDSQDLLQALALLRQLSQTLTAWEPALISAARARGATWTDIAPALGVASRQAAERRYLRLNPQTGDQPQTTREQRVQTTRDRRSGDRAVAAWARDNAAHLRELAGQISALPTRDQGGRASRDAIHTALGDNDVATLLAPLSAAGPALQQSHQALADRVRALDETTTQIRNADHDRRGPTRQASTTEPT